MKSQLLLTFLALSTFSSFGQVLFEKGYFIDNENNRIECLIKNYDWKNNPKEFEFKTDKSDEIQKAGISSVKEFGISGFSKYVRANVKIDRSTTDISRLSNSNDPEWSEELLLLKVIVEGKASLYHYEEKSLSRFFYSVVDSVIQQLIYKEYLTEDNTVGVINKFRQQLWIDVRCGKNDQAGYDRIYYEKKSLEKYFINYNMCINEEYKVYKKSEKSDLFNLKISPGVTLASISIWNNIESSKNTLFESQWSFRLGVENEFLMPFNKNKWAFIIEPFYEYFNSSVQNKYGTITIHYNSIEFPLGFRHYFFLNKDIKIFPNVLYIPGMAINFNSDIKIDYSYAAPKEIKTANSFAFGAGISYKNLSSEVRYYTNRDILLGYSNWFSSYKRISIIVSYTIF
jgi:hypothetical protein